MECDSLSPSQNEGWKGGKCIASLTRIASLTSVQLTDGFIPVSRALFRHDIRWELPYRPVVAHFLGFFMSSMRSPISFDKTISRGRSVAQQSDSFCLTKRLHAEEANRFFTERGPESFLLTKRFGRFTKVRCSPIPFVKQNESTLAELVAGAGEADHVALRRLERAREGVGHKCERPSGTKWIVGTGREQQED